MYVLIVSVHHEHTGERFSTYSASLHCMIVPHMQAYNVDVSVTCSAVAAEPPASEVPINDLHNVVQFGVHRTSGVEVP